MLRIRSTSYLSHRLPILLESSTAPVDFRLRFLIPTPVVATSEEGEGWCITSNTPAADVLSKPKETVKLISQNYTMIQCNNGQSIKLEHKFLDDDYCEEAITYSQEKNIIPEIIKQSGFFVARAIEFYIKETGIHPIYES